MSRFRTVLVALTILAPAAPAFADATVFIGSASSPTRAVRGVAIGVGLLVVGFEFEYAGTSGDAQLADGPRLRTGMGNVLLQSPVAVFRIQPYFTVGAGGYQERLNGEGETNIGINTGGGAKIRLAGPLRVRADYRVFTLRGSPREATVHRFYVGANLAF